MEKVIQIHDLTKSYGIHKGVFHLNFDVYKGEVFGFIGPNGAGKTTTIRHLLGFISADEGYCEIFDQETKANASLIQEKLGYLPGEITFFDHMTGIEFLKLIANLRHLDDLTKMNELVEFFEFDPSSRIKKMSKGMKQKLGLVAAFMHDPEVLILDEPTSGLDPLMQTRFVELIQLEKKKGKTILMSSHSFDEIEKTCDRAGIIKDGILVALEDIKDLKSKQRRVFHIRFKTKEDLELAIQKLNVVTFDHLDIFVEVSGDINPLFKFLSTVDVDHFEEKSQTLEEIFMHFYKKEDVK